MENKTNGLSIGGMVVGIVALILSIIPCTMLFGGILAIVGLILSFIGYKSAKDVGGPTTMAIIGMVLSGLALIVAIAWGTLFAKASGDIAEPLNVETCDEVLVEMEKTVKEMKAFSDKGDDANLSDISAMVKTTTRLAKIKSTSEQMDCSQDSTFRAKMEMLEGQME